jgi:phospho-N-acetylmuramoyl-pentapeptide-transferase
MTFLYIIVVVMSFVGFYGFIIFKPFKERIRSEITHLNHKKSTPTCGGIIFLIIVLLFLIIMQNLSDVKINLIIIFGFFGGILGFIDDQFKYYKNEGIPASVSFKITSIFSLIPGIYNWCHNKSFIRIPFIKSIFKCNNIVPLSILYIPLVWFIFTGSCHSIGITDGINGGLSSVFIVNLIFIILANYMGYKWFNMELLSPIGLKYIIVLLIVMIIYFLFNRNGKIFMGNVGSLFIGYTLASIVILYKMELAMAFLGIVYVIEACSNLLQLFWIRNYKKKLFLFTPIHHHFELQNYSDNQIVLMMIITAIIGGLGFLITLFL